MSRRSMPLSEPRKLSATSALWILIIATTGCTSMSDLKTVDTIDVDRFMGAWYIIAHIPPFMTNDAYNAVERYRRGDKDQIEVLYTFNKGAFDGKLKVMSPTGFLGDDGDDALWGMRFIWPFKADYRVAYLDDDYEVTIIGRNKRDYVWVMARTPHVGEATYQRLISEVANMGYDTTQIRKVPQQPASERSTPQIAKEF